MIQELIDAVRQDSLLECWNETNKQLARIADALERISPQVAGEAQGDNDEVFIDPYTPEPEFDESAGLGDEPKSDARGK